jgi:hypothetical protein
VPDRSPDRGYYDYSSSDPAEIDKIYIYILFLSNALLVLTRQPSSLRFLAQVLLNHHKLELQYLVL